MTLFKNELLLQPKTGGGLIDAIRSGSHVHTENLLQMLKDEDEASVNLILRFYVPAIASGVCFLILKAPMRPTPVWQQRDRSDADL